MEKHQVDGAYVSTTLGNCILKIKAKIKDSSNIPGGESGCVPFIDKDTAQFCIDMLSLPS